MSIDNRKHPRFAFPNGSTINAKLNLVEEEKTFTAKILNISLGGVGLAADKSLVSEFKSLKENTEVQIVSIAGSKQLSRLSGQKLSVRWILNYAPLKNVGIGCEFIELNDESHLVINALLEGQ